VKAARAPHGLWRNRDYVGWLAGQTLSTLGTSVSTFAYPLLVLFETGSAAKTGVVAAAANIGSLSTLLVGGVVADRYSRRRLIIVGALVQAAVVGSVAIAVLAGHVVLAHVSAAGLVDGAVVGITIGAERATLRRVVPAPDYPAATSQMWARDMAVRVVGPPLAGLLFAAARWLPFLCDAASYAGAVVGIGAVRRPLGPDADEATVGEPLRHSLAAGFAFLRGNAYLRFEAVWSAAMNLLASGLTLLVILLVRSLGGDARVIGGVQALAMTGALVGAFASGWVMRRFAGRALFLALSWSLGVACFAIATVGSPWGIAAVQAVVLLLIVPLNVVMETYELQIIPDAMVGRVGNTITLAANGLRWCAPLAVGFLVEATSPVRAVEIWGIALLVVALAAQANRSLHVLDQPIDRVVAA
jgi:MFS family permease